MRKIVTWVPRVGSKGTGGGQQVEEYRVGIMFIIRDGLQVSGIEPGLRGRGRNGSGDSEMEDQGLKYILQIKYTFKYIFFIPIVNSN